MSIVYLIIMLYGLWVQNKDIELNILKSSIGLIKIINISYVHYLELFI